MKRSLKAFCRTCDEELEERSLDPGDYGDHISPEAFAWSQVQAADIGHRRDNPDHDVVFIESEAVV